MKNDLEPRQLLAMSAVAAIMMCAGVGLGRAFILIVLRDGSLQIPEAQSFMLRVSIGVVVTAVLFVAACLAALSVVSFICGFFFGAGSADMLSSFGGWSLAKKAIDFSARAGMRASSSKKDGL